MLKIENPNEIIEGMFFSAREAKLLGSITTGKNSSRYLFEIFRLDVYVTLKPQFKNFDIIPCFDLSDIKVCKNYIIKNKELLSWNYGRGDGNCILLHRAVIADKNFNKDMYIETRKQEITSINSYYVEDIKTAMKIKLLI